MVAVMVFDFTTPWPSSKGQIRLYLHAIGAGTTPILKVADLYGVLTSLMGLIGSLACNVVTVHSSNPC